MGEKGVIRIAAIALALGCAGVATSASAQSLTDRFKSLFGDSPPPPAPTAPAPGAVPGAPPPGPGLSEKQIEDGCPEVGVRAGASTFAVGLPGKDATGNDLRFQATIVRTARDCRREGDEVIAHIGIQGRVIVGPAGAPATVEVPLRVAVVQGGVGEKVIATKAYRTTVPMTSESSVPFTFVADDLSFPVPSVDAIGSYIFYVGFDPQALSPESKPRARKKK